MLRYSDFAEDVSKQASEREVIAMQIERKAEDCYKAEYARRHLGECYEGRISGVTQRGLFIELENGVEGFVPASSLTPSGTMLTEGIRLSDPVSGKNWSLGDTMMITTLAVMSSTLVPPSPRSTSKFAPSAILSTLASRSWLTPADVLSALTSVSAVSNYRLSHAASFGRRHFCVLRGQMFRFPTQDCLNLNTFSV